MSRTYAGLSEADRVQQRRERLVASAFQVVGTQGVSGLGMRAVCRDAGLSQKFFYESFEDIDDLLRVVYAAALDSLLSRVLPPMAPHDLHAIIDAAARLAREDPRVCRILLVEPVADERLRRHVRDTMPDLIQSVLGLKVAVDDIDLRMRFSSLFGSLISLFVEWTEHSLGDDRERFVDYVVALAEAALTDVAGRSLTKNGG